jgi:hypothetical protein
MFIVLAWMNWFHPSEVGLLLRGNQPITNGLQLLKLQDVKDAERLSSFNNNKIVGDQHCYMIGGFRPILSGLSRE